MFLKDAIKINISDCRSSDDCREHRLALTDTPDHVTTLSPAPLARGAAAALGADEAAAAAAPGRGGAGGGGGGGGGAGIAADDAAGAGDDSV